MIERCAEPDLKEWYRSRQRKPLILRGARQVGKSTLVRQFAASNDLTLAEINLERHLYLVEELPRMIDDLRSITSCRKFLC